MFEFKSVYQCYFLAQIHGNRASERKFKVDQKRLQEWQEKKESIEKL